MAKKKPLTREEFFKNLHKEDQATIRNLQKEEATDFVPTGSWVLDQIIGDGSMANKPGGFPRGAIVEIIGDESSGKTTVALSAIRKAQEMGGFGCLLDSGSPALATPDHSGIRLRATGRTQSNANN